MSALHALQFAQANSVNTLSALAQKASLAGRPVSLRAVIHALGDPLQPAQLGLFWDIDASGEIIYHPADDQNVPLNNVQFAWTDPGDSSIRKATGFEITVKNATTGKVFSSGSFNVGVSYGTGDFVPATTYSWSLFFSNAIGRGPDSPSYTFKTVGPSTPLPVPPKIQVIYTGPPSTAQFEIKGTGFLANHVVHVRGVNDAGAQSAYQDTNSDASGTIDLKVTIPCPPNTKLSFSANDGRPNKADLTGTLWSNTATVAVN